LLPNTFLCADRQAFLLAAWTSKTQASHIYKSCPNFCDVFWGLTAEDTDYAGRTKIFNRAFFLNIFGALPGPRFACAEGPFSSTLASTAVPSQVLGFNFGSSAWTLCSPALPCKGPTVDETTTELAHGRPERATCASFAVACFAADETTFHDPLECICFVVSLRHVSVLRAMLPKVFV